VQKKIITIARHKQLIEERTGAKVRQYGQIFKLNPEVADIADKYVYHYRDIELLVLGAIEAGGSGMIDLIAGLFITGWLDSSGKLNRSKPNPCIRIDGRRASYTIAAADSTKSGMPIMISENDIDNILRAKAAVYSGTSVLLQQIGIGFPDLARFYVAGGFGQFLNLENAVSIGLLPDIPLEKFQYIGNSSLMGSSLLMLSREFRSTQTALTERMTYIDLGSFPGFMDEYTAALFLPHTELNCFPQVRKRLKTLSPLPSLLKNPAAGHCEKRSDKAS
jgi:uncharacterized 2Fe-2S/4Fe-4S cluster protein (DUF4445 family)